MILRNGCPARRQGPRARRARGRLRCFGRGPERRRGGRAAAASLRGDARVTVSAAGPGATRRAAVTAAVPPP